MVFNRYKRDEIPEDYRVLNFYSARSLKSKVMELVGRTARICEMHDKKECFEGELSFDNSTPDVFYLLDPTSPEAEREKLTFRFENIEEVFVKNRR